MRNAIAISIGLIIAAAVLAQSGEPVVLGTANPNKVQAVSVTNFPDPQNVAGVVDVGNLPAVQQVAGTVTVNGTAVSSILIDLLDSDVVLDEFSSWESEPVIVDQFTTIHLKFTRMFAPATCSTQWRWAEAEGFFSAGISTNARATSDILGPEVKIVCQAGSLPSTLTDVKVWLRRE